MMGRNTRAAFVHQEVVATSGGEEDSPFIKDNSEILSNIKENENKNSMVISMDGFQQVLTVKGEYDRIVLEGESIAIFTTEECSSLNSLETMAVQAYCIEIANNSTGSSNNDTTASPSSQEAVYNLNFGTETKVNAKNIEAYITTATAPWGLQPLKIDGMDLRTCKEPTKHKLYNCNPLSSGGATVAVGKILGVSFNLAGALSVAAVAVWSFAEAIG